MIYRTYAATLAASGIFSLMLHVASAYVMSEHPNARRVEPPMPAAVKLRITEQPAAPTEALPPVQRTTAERKRKPLPKPVSPDAPATPTPPTTSEIKTDRPYENLLPGATWPTGTVNIPGGQGEGTVERGPPPSTAAQRITNHLSGQLDIPLVYREKTAESRALAKFRKKADGHWYFEFIDGEPVLRAVLFEAFQIPGNLQKIDQLATELKRSEILFVLKQTTKPSLNGWEQFSDQISYEQGGSKVIYERTILTGHDGSSGIILPDEEAKRAIRRDKVALMRLMTSPAYTSRIRNRLIVTKPANAK